MRLGDEEDESGEGRWGGGIFRGSALVAVVGVHEERTFGNLGIARSFLSPNRFLRGNFMKYFMDVIGPVLLVSFLLVMCSTQFAYLSAEPFRRALERRSWAAYPGLHLSSARSCSFVFSLFCC